MIEIRPITETEFSFWRKTSFETYAAEKEREGLSKTDALAEAEASFNRHLPQGRNSPGHYIYSIVKTASNTVVGTLWWGVQKQGTREVAWIFDIVLDTAHRGQGLGKKTMELAQADVKTKGYDKLGLHVFGHNAVAQALYRSLGFETTNIVMYKRL